jgi:phage terminase large subunit-like protein
MLKFDKSLYYYDEQAAKDVIEFIEILCHHVRGDKAGQPLILADFWKEDIIKPAFGIKRKSNGKRRFKTVYLEIGKGNAKSTVGSALALYLLGFDQAKGAEVYSVAGDREQARIIFDTAKGMILEEPELQNIFEPFQYSILRKGTPDFYKVRSSEAGTAHGLIPSAIIFDEVHVQPTRDLWDTMTAGAMKRDECLTFAFTTAGYDKQSICWELHEKALKIKKGEIKDDSFLGVIYSAGPKDDISDPKTWKKANPGLGEIISYENLQIEYNKVLASPAYENTFRRLHLNQWTEVYEAWLTDTEVSACNLGGNKEDNNGLECYGGLDLASTRDFNSLALLFPIDDETANAMMYFWIPRDMIDQRMLKQNMDFTGWIREGLIKTIPGNAVDHNIILDDIRELCKQFSIISIGYDRKFAAPIVIGLSEVTKMDEIDQTLGNISYPTTKLEKLILGKKLNHYGNQVLCWMFSNISIYRGEGDLIRITKKGSQDKVDGCIALVMAIAEWEQAKMQPKGSVYDDPNYMLKTL